MFGNDLINIIHDFDGFAQDGNDVLIMNEIIEAEFASFAVFEPFLTNLITADVEVPNVVGDVGEILLVVNPDLLLGVVVFDLLDKVRAIDGIAANFCACFFHQVELYEAIAFIYEFPK
jgi:hypothetical protein